MQSFQGITQQLYLNDRINIHTTDKWNIMQPMRIKICYIFYITRYQIILPETFCITSLTSFMNTFCTNTKWFRRSVVRLCSKEPTCQTKSAYQINNTDCICCKYIFCSHRSSKSLKKNNELSTYYLKKGQKIFRLPNIYWSDITMGHFLIFFNNSSQ